MRSWSVWQVWHHMGLFCALCPGFEMVKCGSYPGLQLCDNNASSSYGAAQCQGYSGGCQGASNNSCVPDAFWASTLRSADNYEHAWLDHGVLYTARGSGTHLTIAYSVRCVLDLAYVYKLNKSG